MLTVVERGAPRCLVTRDSSGRRNPTRRHRSLVGRASTRARASRVGPRLMGTANPAPFSDGAAVSGSAQLAKDVRTIAPARRASGTRRFRSMRTRRHSSPRLARPVMRHLPSTHGWPAATSHPLPLRARSCRDGPAGSSRSRPRGCRCSRRSRVRSRRRRAPLSHARELVRPGGGRCRRTRRT